MSIDNLDKIIGNQYINKNLTTSNNNYVDTVSKTETQLDAYKKYLQLQQNNKLPDIEDADEQLKAYIKQKTEKNKNVIDTLNKSIYTRDKTIYINNKDAYNKNKLIRVLMSVFFMIFILSIISMMYYLKMIGDYSTITCSVIIIVFTIYKILRDYYWSNVVHTADDISNYIGASSRALLPSESVTSDNSNCILDTNYCNSLPKDYCLNNPNNICCENTNVTNGTYYSSPEEQSDLAIINGQTNMNLL